MQHKIKKHLPYAYELFLKVAEPRVIRIMQFWIYICMGLAGLGVIFSPSERFQEVLSIALVYIFGGFLVVGSALGAIAVLPGIWWLERAGVISLVTGMAIYVVIIVDLGSSAMGIVVALLFGLTFGQRWVEIHGAQLAPKKPVDYKEV